MSDFQHVAFNQGGPTGLQIVFYHDKGISIYNVTTDPKGSMYLIPNDDASRGAMFDLANDYLRTPR